MLLGKDRGDGILMDGDLFQGVLLGLLAIGVVVLAALLATLGGIRKALEQRSSPAGSEPARAAIDAEAGYGSSTQEATAAGTQAASVGPASSGQASSIRGVLEQHGLQEAQQTPLSSASAGTAPTTQEPTPQEEPVVDSVFAAHADDPQEEPFQRDGRWWFRRGDELLLYDEATGQWQPAPDQGGGTASVAGSAPAATQTQPVATTQAVPGVADAVATYWKCPTCGAVNGSTAATCRMCFAARP